MSHRKTLFKDLRGSLHTEDSKLNFSALLEYWVLRPFFPLFSVAWSVLGLQPG